MVLMSYTRRPVVLTHTTMHLTADVALKTFDEIRAGKIIIDTPRARADLAHYALIRYRAAL